MSQKHSLFVLTLVASAPVSALTFVDYTGTIPAAAGGRTAGVAATSANTGDLFPVDNLGTSVVIAGAAVAAFQRLQSDANGNAIPQAGSGVVVAVALEAAAAAGQPIEVNLVPN